MIHLLQNQLNRLFCIFADESLHTTNEVDKEHK
jgi:hypothetical protein